MGETDLAVLLSTMRPRLDDGTYVFATVDRMPLAVTPLMTFREAEGLTLILPEAEAAGLSHGFRCRRITLTVQSSLEAVGFLAAIARTLADAGIPVNPVSAFFHDHLFVPADRADEAMARLQALAQGNEP